MPNFPDDLKQWLAHSVASLVEHDTDKAKIEHVAVLRKQLKEVDDILRSLSQILHTRSVVIDDWL